MAETIIIGVDGGGTRSVAAGMRMDGTLIGFAHGDGLNFNNIGMETARAHLSQLVDGLLHACGHPAVQMLSVGMSALDGACGKEQVRAFAGDVFDPDRLMMHSDAYAALMSATMGAPGMIVICGTGSMILRVDESGQEHVCGGWGYLLRDDLSSYSLAMDGLRRAIAAWEGTDTPSALCDAAMAAFQLNTPRELIDRIFAQRNSPHETAHFARDVLRLAQRGDEGAQMVMQQNIRRMARLILSAAGQEMPRTIWLYGGVFEHHAWVCQALQEALLEHGNVTLRLLPYSPSVGACVYALKQKTVITEEIQENIKKSYKEMWKNEQS